MASSLSRRAALSPAAAASPPLSRALRRVRLLRRWYYVQRLSLRAAELAISLIDSTRHGKDYWPPHQRIQVCVDGTRRLKVKTVLTPCRAKTEMKSGR